MRTSPVSVVQSVDLDESDRDRVRVATEEAKSGTLNLDELPDVVREQVLFALTAVARGQGVVALSEDAKPLTTTEAARLLGMSRSHLQELCESGQVESFKVGTHTKVHAAEVQRILIERARMQIQAREAAESADQRRRDRAARRAGLD